MGKANDQFMEVYEKLIPLVEKSRSQNMHTLLASCINSEADEESLRKITEALREQLDRHEAGQVE